MKKRLLTLILLAISILTFSLGLVGCQMIPSTNSKKKINFIVDGEVYATVKTNGNESITLPENPKKVSYTFDGWYYDEFTWQNEFKADSLIATELTKNVAVYAKFSVELEHNYIETLVLPTCEEQGYTIFTCLCGHTYNGNYVDALGHNGVYVPNSNGTHTLICTNDATHVIKEN